MGDGIRYSQVVPNSHFWTDLEQLLVFFDYQELSREYLLTGLKNTMMQGYGLQKLRQITATTKPYFENIISMAEYVDKEYNKDMFVKMLKNTIDNGIDLIEGKKVYKINVGNIPEDEIDDYVKRIAKQFKTHSIMERKEVYNRIDTERDYQDLRWSPRREKNNTPDEQKPPAEWLNYIEYHLSKAKEKVYMLEDENALAEVRKIAALAVRCLELHGCPERIIPDELK